MFPRENTPQISKPRRPETRGWEAIDRVAVQRSDEPAASPAPAPSWRAAAGRALGLARAFLLLEDSAPAEDPGSPRVPAGAPAHPHRQPLRPSLRSRRPGAAAPREQHCLTPLARDRAASRPGADSATGAPRATSARVPGWQLR
ncbi:MAG TPA: hypothetical protein VIL55_09300 [Naasia sp.]